MKFSKLRLVPATRDDTMEVEATWLMAANEAERVVKEAVTALRLTALADDTLQYETVRLSQTVVLRFADLASHHEPDKNEKFMESREALLHEKHCTERFNA